MTKPEVVTWSVVAAALVGVVALAIWARHDAPAPPPPAPASEPAEAVEAAGVAPEPTTGLLPRPAGEIGDFPCVERSGKAVSTADLRGKFVVADFIFTNCGGTCPQMSSHMQRLQGKVKSMNDVVLASFSVDPERDTVQALATYADNLGADKERWLFLRCERPVMQQIVYDRLGLAPSRDEIIMHSSKFALLDRTGRLVGLYSPLLDPKWIEKLLPDLDKLRREPAK